MLLDGMLPDLVGLIWYRFLPRRGERTSAVAMLCPEDNTSPHSVPSSSSCLRSPPSFVMCTDPLGGQIYIDIPCTAGHSESLSLSILTHSESLH